MYVYMNKLLHELFPKISHPRRICMTSYSIITNLTPVLMRSSNVSCFLSESHEIIANIDIQIHSFNIDLGFEFDYYAHIVFYEFY